MTHTIRDKRKLLARVRRVRGQVDAVERAVEDGAECEQVMHLIAGIRGSMTSLMAEVMEDHVRTHFTVAQTGVAQTGVAQTGVAQTGVAQTGVAQTGVAGGAQDRDGGGAVEQLVEVMRAYLK